MDGFDEANPNIDPFVTRISGRLSALPFSGPRKGSIPLEQGVARMLSGARELSSVVNARKAVGV